MFPRFYHNPVEKKSRDWYTLRNGSERLLNEVANVSSGVYNHIHTYIIKKSYVNFKVL